MSQPTNLKGTTIRFNWLDANATHINPSLCLSHNAKQDLLEMFPNGRRFQIVMHVESASFLQMTFTELEKERLNNG